MDISLMQMENIIGLSKEIQKSNFRQYGQMKSRDGKSQREEKSRREKIREEKESEERRCRCAKR